MNSSQFLNYFISYNKLTKEFTLSENNLIKLTIPPEWQKPDSNVNNSTLWICYLPENSLGITKVELYPNELIIKKTRSGYSKEDHEKVGHSEKDAKKWSEYYTEVWKGILEVSGENEVEKYYRVRLEKILKFSTSSREDILGIIVLIVVVLIAIIFWWFLFYSGSR